jgi:hypothetical protein
MDITINTPALLFPAISLVMLAYTNRFLALASVIRSLHDRYKNQEEKHVLHGQIKNIRFRLKLVQYMQAFGVVTFLGSILSMYCIYINSMILAHIVFAGSLISFVVSLILSLWEIQLSNKALELQLGDMEGLEDPTVLEYIKKKLDMD